LEKGETHTRLVAQAAHAFREKGLAVPISELMKDIGMTHGGFYRHFASKEDLLVESVAAGLREVADRLDAVARRAEKGAEVEAIITAYLSMDQLRHPENWCALAALGPDLARQPESVRMRLGEAMQYYSERLTPFLPGNNREEQGRNFLILFSGMAGAMVMLRVLPDPEAQERTLGMVRGYYLATFGGTGGVRSRA
jgi:TetR/AcrR family transcriptional repressor of nem operon